MCLRPLLTAVFLFIVLSPQPGAQSLDVVGEVMVPINDSLNTGGSDVWDYTAPNGSEYAIMGDVGGVSIVAVPSLETVARVDGPTEDDRYYHRDIKTYQNYAYVVTENLGRSEGLQIIDLSGLPESVEEVAVIPGPDSTLVSSHNLYIDTQAGFAYVLDSGADGLYVLDLADPEAPEPVAYLDVEDVHDVYARNNRVYIAEGRSPTFSIWDLTDKADPRVVSRVTIPSAGYVHNIWPTDDGTHVLTTEETVEKTVKVWNVKDLDNPTLVGEWLGDSRLAHNVLVKGDYAFLSHYTSGIHVLDISDLSNPTEVAHHDTYPANDASGFFGTWGATLPTESGYVYASDLEGKLTVLRWTPERVDS